MTASDFDPLFEGDAMTTFKMRGPSMLYVPPTAVVLEQHEDKCVGFRIHFVYDGMEAIVEAIVDRFKDLAAASPAVVTELQTRSKHMISFIGRIPSSASSTNKQKAGSEARSSGQAKPQVVVA